MIIHDYQCQVCEEVTEHFITDSGNIPKQILCPICNGYADKIVSMSQTNPVDSPWIASVTDVVDRDSNKPHVKEFLRHPTRSNYKAWMKGEGLRPFESGERTTPVKKDKRKAKAKIKDKLMKRYQERNAIAI